MYITFNETKLSRDAELFNLAGLDSSEVRPPYDAAESEALAALETIRRLRSHAHQWGEDDYCSVCGADGRA